MGDIFRLQYVHQYPEVEIGWQVYDLICYPIPVLALRNLNDYDEQLERHSTFTWKTDSTFRTAMSLTFDLLRRWQAFRSSTPGFQDKLRQVLEKELPEIVTVFQEDMKRLGVRRILDVCPNDDCYNNLLASMGHVIEEIASHKGVDNPMLGSKVMHFFFPEFFPVWDTEWIKKKCLVNEHRSTPKEVLEELAGSAGAEYTAYVDLMVRDLAKTPDYAQIKQACLQRANIDEEVVDWHYDDLAPTVFEICLLGKHAG